MIVFVLLDVTQVLQQKKFELFITLLAIKKIYLTSKYFYDIKKWHPEWFILYQSLMEK